MSILKKKVLWLFGAAGIGRMEINIPVHSSVIANNNHLYVIKVSGLKGGALRYRHQ